MCAAQDLRTINTHSCPGSVTSLNTHTRTHTHLYFYSILVRVLLSFITQKSHVCIACQRFSSSLTYKFHLFSCLLTESIFGLLHSFYIILFHDSRTNEKRVHLYSSFSTPPILPLLTLISVPSFCLRPYCRSSKSL